MKRLSTALLILSALSPRLPADPCGLVPPAWSGPGYAVERVDLQQTYLFYRDGIETLVLRPAYKGSAEDFGMLIPFPTPPSVRKVDERVFDHLAAAVDPPEVVLVRPAPGPSGPSSPGPRAGASGGPTAPSQALRTVDVELVRQEAVGLYEVAVLRAGSAGALSKWMDHHGFLYPEGMDAVCQEYVEEGWCFVAVRTRVVEASTTEPSPGMRRASPSRAPGSGFEGHVQAMGFRFETPKPVLPMRLSAHNPGPTRNRVFALLDHGVRILNLDPETVVRQIDGEDLRRNLLGPIPLRSIGYSSDEALAHVERGNIDRDPGPHNGVARDLFADDLAAVGRGALELDYEAIQREWLEIDRDLGLLHGRLERARRRALLGEESEELLGGLDGMVMTVIDGEFPRAVLAKENLRLQIHRMGIRRNRRANYDCTLAGRRGEIGGVLVSTEVKEPGRRSLLDFQEDPTPTLDLGRLESIGATGRLIVALALAPTPDATDPSHDDREGGDRDRGDRNRGERDGGDPDGVDGAGVDPVSEEDDPRRQLRRWALDLGEPELVRAWAVGGMLLRAENAAHLRDAMAVAPEAMDLLRPAARRSGDLGIPEVIAEWILRRLPERVGRRSSPWVGPGGSTGPVGPGFPGGSSPAGIPVGARPEDTVREFLMAVLFELDPRGLAYLAVGRSSTTDALRRRAGAWLGARAREVDLVATRGAWIDALRIEPGEGRLPWSGGALWIPSFAKWEGAGADRVVEEFLVGMLWAESHGLDEELAQIERALRSAASITVRAPSLASDEGSRRRGLRAWSEAYRSVMGEAAFGALGTRAEAVGDPRDRDG